MTDTERLAPGDKAPAFTLPDADGKKVSLADYKGHRVIIYFYPAASTPGCTKQACDFRDNLSELNGAGLDIVGISPDKPEKLAKFRDAEGLTFPLLSDPERKVLTAYGAFGEKKMYGKTVQGVIRSTFVVDEKGKIAEAQYNVKATGHVAKLRRDLSVWPMTAASLYSVIGRAIPCSSQTRCSFSSVSSIPGPSRLPDVKVAGRCCMPWITPIVR